MRYAIFPALLASPALAHPGAHLTPHDSGSWLSIAVALAGTALVGGYVAARGRT